MSLYSHTQLCACSSQPSILNPIYHILQSFLFFLYIDLQSCCGHGKKIRDPSVIAVFMRRVQVRLLTGVEIKCLITAIIGACMGFGVSNLGWFLLEWHVSMSYKP